MLSKINQAQKDKYCMFSLKCEMQVFFKDTKVYGGLFLGMWKNGEKK